MARHSPHFRGALFLPPLPIAHGCGFSDLSWFNQAFKRRFGRTPTGIRRQGEDREA